MPDLFRKFFLTAPVAQAVIGPEGALFPNRACRQLMGSAVAADPAVWERWLAGAVVRLAATGRIQDVVRAPGPDHPELMLQMGPEVHREGLRVLSLRPVGAQEVQSESLAETVSTLYHELRTPLASMKSSLQLVSGEETGPLNDDQKRFLGMTIRNLDRLDRLVGDLLDTSRAAAGCLVLDPWEGDLLPDLQELLDLHREEARRAGLKLILEEAPGSLEVSVDRDKVIQMVTNILGNALKFTPSGGEVRMRISGGVVPETFEVAIEDTGPGMDRSSMDAAFEPFRRVHDEKNHRVPGAGLGLHITRNLVQAHGGRIEMDSEPGRGTLVRIVLPRRLGVSEPALSV